MIVHLVKWFGVLVLAGLVLGETAPLRAEPFTEIIAFGDSLTDTGNVFASTGGVPGGPFPPSPPYFNGRFSNGPVYVEHLAARLGLAAPTPSVLGGTNYAFGGAQTGPGLSRFGTPNVGTQIDLFLATSPTLGPQQLIVLFAGANDFSSGSITDPAVPVMNLATHITTLAGAGGQDFLVPNLPPVVGPLGAQFNSLLAGTLDNLEASLGVTIFRLDVFGLFGEIEADPGAFGFTNLTEPALINGGIGLTGGPVVPNPDEYLFWDSIHPTRVAHEILGDRAAQAVVPEPSSILLFGLAAVTAVFIWRRRWRVEG